ncbi:GTP-binding protein RHO4 [Hanseniaspora osmophila]|uniref:GTP-binding protein RHO4 n=1 Tax=Hanseniaspora osmophila TaxID=56408 RepID=A0A1E5RP92_9ASCO|nr:GTP-binding protein RHO4 [Hanseniaspora osmophila]
MDHTTPMEGSTHADVENRSRSSTKHSYRPRAYTMPHSISSGQIEDYFADKQENKQHDIKQTLSKKFDQTWSTVDSDENIALQQQNIQNTEYGKDTELLFEPLSPIFSPAFQALSTSVFSRDTFSQKNHSTMLEQTLTLTNSSENVDMDYKLVGKRKKRNMKIVILGDSQVGKTTLLWTFTRKKYPVAQEIVVPRVFENYVVTVQLENIDANTPIKNGKPHDAESIDLVLWDVPGVLESQSGTDTNVSLSRPLAYNNVDLVIVCYSFDNLEKSFNSAKELWIPEARHFCVGAPIFLVGLKNDVIGSKVPKHMKQKIEKIEKIDKALMANKNNQFQNVVKHIKCSSKNLYNVDVLFHEAMQDIIKRNQTSTQKRTASHTTQPKNTSKHRGKQCILM